MAYKDLVIINNEKISSELNNFYCDNIDIKTIPEDLNKNFNINLIARKSKVKRTLQINIDNNKIKTSSNILLFILSLFKTFKKKQVNYLIISITPYTFCSYLLLLLFKKKVFLYLRSNGYEEYKEIFGYIGPAIYYVMFKIVTFKSSIIVCQERLFTKRKVNIVFPSELNSLWFENIKTPLMDKPRLLYVGRMKVEKGIFSLLKIFEGIAENINLSIVGKMSEQNSSNKKVNYIGHGYDPKSLIEIYDNHNISILPSFTEAHPKVIDESLARMRPVIIFEEIKHIIQNKEGIFVTKRNTKSLLETVNFIMKNYYNIQEKMKQNKLPTKKEFISQMSNILNSN